MNCREGRRKIDFSDYLRLAFILACRVDDDEVVGGDGAQADGVCWIGFVDPVPVSAALMQESRFLKLFTKCRNINLAKDLMGRNGQFECRTFQMIDKNLQIVGPNVSVLRGTLEKVIRVLHDKLIEWRR